MKYLIKLIVVIFITSQAKGQNAQRFFPEADLITTGIYYYPEHWNENQWERDIKKISEMGFEFVHIAEFAWFKLEPVEGKYDFSWLDKVVHLCEKYHLKIVMCTPSATTPTWMRTNYPKTFIMYGNYIRAENGTRGLGSVVNPKYRMFVKNIVAEMAKRHGQNKNITGWQLDNEPPALADYSPSSQEAFRQWLKKKYKTILTVNIANVPNGDHALEVYKVGYRSNDAYSTYLSMGKPAQLTKQQVEQIKKQNDGSPFLKEIITVKDGISLLKELDIRENDVFFLNLIRL